MRVQKENQSSSINTKDIIEYYNEGHTLKECGLRFGLNPETIRVRFRKAGIKDCRKNFKRKPIDNMSEIIEFYKLDHSLDECSSKFGVSVPRLRKEFKSLGVLRNKFDVFKLISKKSEDLWKDESIRNKMISNNKWNDDRREKSRDLAKSCWKGDNYKNKISVGMKKKWSDPKFRNKMIKKFNDIDNRREISSRCKLSLSRTDVKEKMAVARANQPRVSSLQTILYSILDDLNVKYFREYPDRSADQEVIIGPYNFDCAIPLLDKKLLIECQGDYWHSLDKAIRTDKSKSTYIEKYHKDCELKYLWEHEFLEKDRIIELIKYWVGKTEIELVDFDFKSVEIRGCPASDYKLLLSKYHYLPNAGRGGIAYGVYLNDELIAVCIFSPLIRQNLPYDYSSTRELSRLCVHPKYQKKNFASWFVSRCIKSLDAKYKTIISYCDTTFNHNGAVYKACNFKLDGEVKPDYWYMSEDGWVMHKKTLYGHAKKMGLKEKEYSDKFGYKKVYGKEKLRFVYER